MMVPMLSMNARSLREYADSRIIGGRSQKKKTFELNSRNLIDWWVASPLKPRNINSGTKREFLHEEKSEDDSDNDQTAWFWQDLLCEMSVMISWKHTHHLIRFLLDLCSCQSSHWWSHRYHWLFDPSKNSSKIWHPLLTFSDSSR